VAVENKRGYLSREYIGKVGGYEELPDVNGNEVTRDMSQISRVSRATVSSRSGTIWF